MDCWERAWHTNTHLQTHTHLLSQAIDISAKWASSNMCMNGIRENGRSWWKAAWSLIRNVRVCWVAVSSWRKTLVETLPEAINIQRETRGYFFSSMRWHTSSITETKECWQIISWGIYKQGYWWGKPHRIHTGWVHTEQIGLISTELVPDRCRLGAEASLWLLRQRLIVNADVFLRPFRL